MNCLDIIECAGSIATAISLIFIIKQTYNNKKSIDLLASQTELLRKEYQYNSEWQEKNKAIEMSRYYKDNIIPQVSYIDTILKKTGVLQLLERISPKDMKSFTFDELVSLAGEEIKENVIKRLNNPKNINIFLEERLRLQQLAKRNLLHNINPDLINNWVNVEKNGGETENVSREQHAKDGEILLSALIFEYRDIVLNTMNSLEYFSMNFITRIADEETVYLSLHQTYLKIMRRLYYNIASFNNKPKDKFFTSAIQLYQIWSTRDAEMSEKADGISSAPKPVKK